MASGLSTSLEVEPGREVFNALKEEEEEELAAAAVVLGAGGGERGE